MEKGCQTDCPFIFIESRNYMIPKSLKIMRMTAITISVWIQPPVCGKLGLMFRPKKPSSHRIIKITMIVYNIRALLFERFAQYGGLNSVYQLQNLDYRSLWVLSKGDILAKTCGPVVPSGVAAEQLVCSIRW